MLFPDERPPLEIVRELAALLEQNNLGELSLEATGSSAPVTLRLRRELVVVASTPARPSQLELDTISSESEGEQAWAEIDGKMPRVEEGTAAEQREIGAPCVGVFRAAKRPVSVGDLVKTGQIIAVVESLRVPNEVYATFDARVAAIPVVEGQGVEWGQTLLVLEPTR